jgi:hypothetical protein
MSGDARLDGGTSLTVLELLDRLVRDLGRPLSRVDRAGGWTDDSRRQWRRHFIDLRARLARGEGTAGEECHLMRWFNFDGIGTGPLADQASALQRRLNETFPDPHRDVGSRFSGRETRRFLRELGIRPRRRKLWQR